MTSARNVGGSGSPDAPKGVKANIANGEIPVSPAEPQIVKKVKKDNFVPNTENVQVTTSTSLTDAIAKVIDKYGLSGKGSRQLLDDVDKKQA